MLDINARQHNLDLAVGLAANGRIEPSEVLEVAESFDTHLSEETDQS